MLEKGKMERPYQLEYKMWLCCTSPACSAHWSQWKKAFKNYIWFKIRAVYLSMGQPILLSRGRCLVTKACSSSCEYICSCLHMRWALYKFLCLKIDALLKRIMDTMAAFFHSFFHQSYFISCCRRHLTEKAERVKWKKTEGIRLRKRMVSILYTFYTFLSFWESHEDWLLKNQFLRELISN